MDLIFLKSLRPLYCDYISRILCVRRAQQRRPPRPPFMYFYSRPYARGDDTAADTRWSAPPISTHAPTRGATLYQRLQCENFRDFYSRPYERGDKRVCGFLPHEQDFYSRPYARGDFQPIAKAYQAALISTHAPTRGATAIFHKTTS